MKYWISVYNKSDKCLRRDPQKCKMEWKGNSKVLAKTEVEMPSSARESSASRKLSTLSFLISQFN